MNKFHINSKGEAGACGATSGKCPFGGESGEDNHFDSMEDAAVAAMEQEQANEPVANLKRVAVSSSKSTPGSVAPDSFGTYAATSPDGERRAGFATRAEAQLFGEGFEVTEEHFMEGHGLALHRKGREVGAITPKDGKWLLGVRDVDLNWRPIPRTVGVYTTKEEALQAYADGRR